MQRAMMLGVAYASGDFSNAALALLLQIAIHTSTRPIRVIIFPYESFSYLQPLLAWGVLAMNDPCPGYLLILSGGDGDTYQGIAKSPGADEQLFPD